MRLMKSFVLTALLATSNAMAQQPMAIDSIWAPLNSTITATATLSLTDKTGAPLVTAPIVFTIAQSPISLTFTPTTGITATGLQMVFNFAGVGYSGSSTINIPMGAVTVVAGQPINVTYNAPLMGQGTLLVAAGAPPPPPVQTAANKPGDSICTGSGPWSLPCTKPALTQLVDATGGIWTIAGSVVSLNGKDTKQPYPDANILYVFQNAPGSKVEISVFSPAHGHLCASATLVWGGC